MILLAMRASGIRVSPLPVLWLATICCLLMLRRSRLTTAPTTGIDPDPVIEEDPDEELNIDDALEGFDIQMLDEEEEPKKRLMKLGQ